MKSVRFLTLLLAALIGMGGMSLAEARQHKPKASHFKPGKAPKQHKPGKFKTAKAPKYKGAKYKTPKQKKFKQPKNKI